MVALIITLRIIIEIIRPGIEKMCKKVAVSISLIADIYDDKSYEEHTMIKKIIEMVCNRWKYLFVYPIALIGGAYVGFKSLATSIDYWMEMSNMYKTTILLPWISDIHSADKYFLLPVTFFAITIVIEVYERLSKKNRVKKKVKSLVIIGFLSVVEMAIFSQIASAKVFIIIIFELMGSIHKVKFDRIMYNI